MRKKNGKKRGRPPTTGNDIFSKFVEGNQSVTSIHNTLYPPKKAQNFSNTDQEEKSVYPMIHRWVKKLRKKEKIIGFVGKSKSNHKKPQNFYGLNTDGLKQYVNRYNPSSFDFWQKMFSTFDDPANHKLNINLDKIVEEFKNKSISVPKDMVVESYIVKKFNGFKYSTRNRQEFHNNIMPILEFLGKKGKVLHAEFSKKLINSDYLNCFRDDRSLELMARGLVAKVYHKSHKNYIGLSQFGILLLINNYFEKFGEQGNRSGFIDEDEYSRFEFETIPEGIDKQATINKIGTAILKHRFLFPKIFLKIRPNDTAYIEKVASILSKIHFGNEPNQFDGDEETLFLLYSQKAMQRDYNRVVMEDHIFAIYALIEWIKKTECNFPVFTKDRDCTTALRSLLVEMKHRVYVDMNFIRATRSEKFLFALDAKLEPTPSRMVTDSNDNDILRRASKVSENEIHAVKDLNDLFTDTIKNILEHDGILKLEKLEQKLKKSIMDILEQNYISNMEGECDNLLKIFQNIMKIVRVRNVLEKIFLEAADNSRMYNLQNTLDVDYDLKTQYNQNVKSIENIVSFQFYTYLKSYSPSDWNKIMSEDAELDIWYQDWLRHIKQFNIGYEKNIMIN